MGSCFMQEVLLLCVIILGAHYIMSKEHSTPYTNKHGVFLLVSYIISYIILMCNRATLTIFFVRKPMKAAKLHWYEDRQVEGKAWNN